jgi:hypothetical protein
MADDRIDYEIPLDSKKWRSDTDQQRGWFIEQVYITLGKLLSVCKKFESIDARTRYPEIRTPYSLASLYNAGSGKIVAAQHWMNTSQLERTLPNPEGKEPYLYISLCPFTSRYSLLAHCLAKFEDPNLNRGKYA